MNAWCLSRWAPLTDLHLLRLSYPECYLNYLMTLLCHDKVHCSIRELRDEPLPVVSDLLFLLKTSSKMPHNLTKLRHWLPLQHPVALGFPPRGFYQVLTRFFGLALSKPLSSGASVMPTAGPCVRNGKWSCRLRSSHRPPPLLQEQVLVHSRHWDTLLIGVETNAQAAMDFFATIWWHYFYC